MSTISTQLNLGASYLEAGKTEMAVRVLEQAGFDVGFDSFEQAVSDLRAQAMGNVLNNAGPPLTRTGLAAAKARFEASRAPDGLIRERFEFVTLTGRNPVPHVPY